MNFLDKHPSENRMEFTKLKVARKYASIGRGCACCWLSDCCGCLFAKWSLFCLENFALWTILSGILRTSCRDWYWIMVGWQSYQTELWLGTERNWSKNSVWYGCKPSLIQYQSQNDGSDMSEWLVRSRSRMPLSEGPFFYELFLQNCLKL